MPNLSDLVEIFRQDTNRRGFVAGALGGLTLRVREVVQPVGGKTTHPLVAANPVDQGPVFIEGAVWHFIRGDLSGSVDGMRIVQSDRVPPMQGAWVRHDDRTTVQRSDAGAVPTKISDLMQASPRRPEEFGAAGDGVQDDAPAIQRALDAIALASAGHRDGSTRPGELMLTQGRRYRCGSRIVIDRRFHNVSGHATLDFSGWSGVYVQVSGTHTEFGNGYGQSGSINGQIVIVGKRGVIGGPSVGILYESPIPASNTSIRTIGVTVTQCDVAFQIGSRGYNQDFVNCKAFDCDVIFDWVRQAEDNDERISVFGGTFYNSRLFLKHQRDAGAFYAFGCSIDYTEAIADIVSGKVQLFGVHLESSRWRDKPIKVAGNGGLFCMQGGWLFMMDNKGNATHLFGIDAGCCAKMQHVVTHNTHKLLAPDSYTPTTWATGEGRFEMHGTEPAFEFGGFPARLHDRANVLADPGFEEADVQTSPVWRMADVNPIRSRDGRDPQLEGEAAHNISLSRVTSGQMEGRGCLRIDKAHGSGSPAAVAIVVIPVRHGDKAKGGFRIRTAPDRLGASQQVVVRGGFAVLDGADAHGVPIVRKFAHSGDLTLTPPTGRYVLAVPGNGGSDFTTPTWATHYLIQIDLSLAAHASFLIDGRWADRW